MSDKTMGNNYSCKSTREIIELLPDDKTYSVNSELAGRIVVNDTIAVRYYLSDICIPITSIIEKKIIHRNIVGEFYEFISSPFDSDKGMPEWHKISLYEGVDCRLSTYTSCIASRHFCKIAKKEKKINSKEANLLDFVDYEALLNCDQAEEYDESPTQRRMRKAFNLLSERDKIILKCTIIDKTPSLEAFHLVEQFIKPRSKDGLTSEQIKNSWDDKRRQDAVALIKGRALDHLEQLYHSVK